MSALFNFNSFLITVLLFICLCAYVRAWSPQMIKKEYSHGFKGIVRSAAIIGDRCSPIVSGALIYFAVHNIFIRDS